MARRKVNITMPNLDNLNLEVRLEGQWTQLDRLSDKFIPSVKLGYDKGISHFAQRILSVVKRSLATGIPPPNSGTRWPELADSYVKRYGQHPIYHLTGLYFRSVDLWEYKSRTLVGLPINKRRADSGGLTLNQLAVILEYGSRLDGTWATGYIPARPIWGPTLKSVGGTEELKKIILTNIRRQLRVDCGVHARQVRYG